MSTEEIKTDIEEMENDEEVVNDDNDKEEMNIEIERYGGTFVIILGISLIILLALVGALAIGLLMKVVFPIIERSL